MRRTLSILTLTLALFTVPAAMAYEPTTAAVAHQKARALDLFSRDAKVQASLQGWLSQGYTQLSVDAVPYAFVYGDEGMITNFLVTAWLGKSSQYGWTPAFVSAIVNTDSFGGWKVALVNPSQVQTFLKDFVPQR